MNPPPPTWVVLLGAFLCAPIYYVCRRGDQFIGLSMLCMFCTIFSWILYSHA